MLDMSDRGTIGITVAILASAWLLWTIKLQNPTKHSHLFISQDLIDQEKLNELEHEHIAEWYINETENLIVVKYISDTLSEEELKAKIYL